MSVSLEQYLADSSAPAHVKHIYGDLGLTVLDLEEFKRIYTEDDTRLNLLNDTAQVFFNRLHRLYITSFVVSIGRYLDGPRFRKDENISLGSLKEIATELPFKQEIDNLINQAQEAAKPLLIVRNKLIAHADAATILGDGGFRFNVLIKDIEQVLLLVEKILNLFFQHYDGHTRSWQRLPPSGGALSLIRQLER